MCDCVHRCIGVSVRWWIEGVEDISKGLVLAPPQCPDPMAVHGSLLEGRRGLRLRDCAT